METPEPAPPSPGLRYARWMIGGGVALIVAAALTLSSAGYGTRVRRDFAERRSYDMIKPDVHRAMPRAAMLGLLGLTLILAGARVQRRGP